MGLPQVEPIYTVEEYLAFERAAEERHEYVDGYLYEMAGESPKHGRVSVNLIRLISTHLLGKPCEVFTKDMKVRSGPLPANRLSTKGLFSYPDLVIVCGKMEFLDDHQDVLTNPTLIIEVLSDSTASFDRVLKFQRYQQYLPSLKDYLLVAQDQPRIELFHRRNAELWHYTTAGDLKGKLRIASIKYELRLAEVYDRITFPVKLTLVERASRKPSKPARKAASTRKRK